MEEVATVTLNLWNQKRKVISHKLVRSEYFGCGTIEVIIFSPRRLPVSHSLVTIEKALLVYEVTIAVYLIVLVDISEVVFAC